MASENEEEEALRIQEQQKEEKLEEEEEALELGLGLAQEELKPWEQHSAVISIPRYDYKAPSSLLNRSLSGFLITCPIKREKSATKEAISILGKFVRSMAGNGSAWLESCSTNTTAKKRKVCSEEEADVKNVESAKGNGDDNTSEITCEVVEAKAGENVKSGLDLSLVKLTRSGLLLFTFPTNNFYHVVGVLSSILVSLGSGNLKRPLWCNRIFPIQETCILTEKNLQIVVSKLVQEYVAKGEKLARPIKFAVGYNRRGIEETEMKNSRSIDSKAAPLLDRENCFKIVAGAFKDVAENSIVDLKSPEVAVLVEVLPVSGLPHESVVAGVSVLPIELISTKPRLCVKPLVSDAKPTKRKN